jgi:hypothetical protein
MKTQDSRLSIFEYGIEEPALLVESLPLSCLPSAPSSITLPSKSRIGSSPVNEVKKQKQSRTKNAASSPAQPIPVLAGVNQLKALQSSSGLLTRALNWIRTCQLARAGTKRLHVAATASLGEKRFVAVIQIDGLEFLIGGGASNVALLAQLKGKDSFGDLLHETITAPKRRIAKLTKDQTSVQA